MQISSTTQTLAASHPPHRDPKSLCDTSLRRRPQVGCCRHRTRRRPQPTSSSLKELWVERKVEAFALRANDLKFVANQFRPLHNKRMRHISLFYSRHWHTWTACFIHAAWRRYKQRKVAKDLV
ncbi:cyclic nucleotide-gated channel 17 [Striga asiatica]|uniref:Cyclic nucleotide-gated channel 17 n=1 Tax=Striga asiatica TaxID=4170 RepID=A0A5A7NWG7_STRAF|nr:cyclic nucleotide-gated channel 17 [Striga asiatica]